MINIIKRIAKFIISVLGLSSTEVNYFIWSDGNNDTTCHIGDHRDIVNDKYLNVKK